jgi:glycosyltransferase involved in cell wall biosynthesis
VKRRILLLITDLEIGGTPTVVRELAIRLNHPPEVQVEVACLAKWGAVADQLREAGIRVTALWAAGVRDVGVVRRFAKLVRERRIDTVFSFLIHANVVAAVGSLFLRDVRFIQSIQTTQPRPRWHWWLQLVAHHAADRVVVPSESVAKVASQRSDIGRGKLEVISNAIDCSTGVSPVPHGRDARATRKVGFLGRLDPIKRVPDLLEAMALLDEEFGLHIFGDGAERNRIQSEIARLGLQQRVTLHGTTANPQAAIAQMDVLVLPSQAEGFGLVLIDAMAARVPVVATNVPGIRDVVRNEQTGLLVPVGEPAELAKAIRRVTEDHALRERLVAAAFEDVQQRFSWPAVLRQYRELLKLEER